MRFAKLFGHDFVKKHLSALFESGHFPQVSLFNGPKGVGKKAFALECARMVLGESHGDKIEQKNHPDVHFFEPEGKSEQHTIESIRGLITQVFQAPFEAPKSFFIIDEADRMPATSANALLKILEEPPSHAFFILITHNIDKLPPTLISRSQKIDFPPLPSKAIATYLEEHYAMEKSKASKVAMMAQGSLSRAIALTEQQEEWSISALLANILSLSITEDFIDVSLYLSKLQELVTSSSEEGSANSLIERVFEETLYWFRDREAMKLEVTWNLIYHQDHEDLLKKSCSLSYVSFEEAFDLIMQAQEAVFHNVKFATAFEHFLMRAQKAIRAF